MTTKTNAAPELKLKRTVSNPADPVEVLGFEVRDAVVGLDGLLMKEDALVGGVLRVPNIDRLEDGGMLYLIDGDEIVTISGPEFIEAAELTSVRTDHQEQPVTVYEAQFDGSLVRAVFDREHVETDTFGV